MENPQAEPSMEEILASIRRIISEDDEDAAASEGAAKSEPARAQAAPKAEKKPEKPVPQPRVVEAKADDDTAKTRIAAEDVEMIKKNAKEAVMEGTEAMLEKSSAEAATQAFQTLSQTVRVSDGQGRTMEDIVIQMLQPMVKEWLDANLPAIVEEKVEEEVQRVSRRRA